MKYGEAFQRLGYVLDIPRLDWTASSEKGICITLWHSEIDWPSLTLDTRVHCGPIEDWNAAGKNKRNQHLRQALEEFDGWVDAVIVKGEPGRGVDSAEPWFPKDRRGLRWRVTSFEPEGHFIVKAIHFEQ